MCIQYVVIFSILLIWSTFMGIYIYYIHLLRELLTLRFVVFKQLAPP